MGLWAKAVGIIGKKNLVEAVLSNFSHAAHVRCFRHMQQNIEMSLRDRQFPSCAVKKYTRDIFGWTDSSGMYHEGLVDSAIFLVLMIIWLP